MKPLVLKGAWLAPVLTMLAAMAAMVVVYAGAAWATSVSEVEPNDSIAEAQNIDPDFSLDSDPNIALSTSASHATVDGTGGTGNATFDYYAFSVPQAGSSTRGFFDIDGASPHFDSYLLLYDSNGNFLAGNDDNWSDPGSEPPPPSFTLDSSLEYTFPSAGTYYIAVGSCCVGPVPNEVTYQLHVSFGNHPFLCQGQPATISAQSSQSINGTKGDDVIAGTLGPDTIKGNGGNDTLCGNLGNDRINGDRGSDSLFGEGGDDTLNGGLGPDYIAGGDGTDKCSLGENGRDECELAFGPNVNP
jgi:Bacterial pre-peptidase C-terminal domain/RTX calcium-binding nonapeptide repeat (4 copies)